MTELKKQRKKNKAGDNPEVEVSDHVALHDRIFDENRLSNRIAELLFEICEEKNWTSKQVLLALLEPVMSAYLNKSVQEEVPSDVDKDPSMGSVGVCGFNSDMAGMAFTPLVESEEFHTWMYQVIKTHPYCYPLRGKSNLKLSGSIEHRIIILTTTVLGIFWNNRVKFGEGVVVKKPTDSATDLPDFTPKIIEAVKKVIRGRARICRSNLSRGKVDKKKIMLQPGDENSEIIEDVETVQVPRKQRKRKSPMKKKGNVVSKKKLVLSETVAILSSSEDEEEEEEVAKEVLPSYKQVSSSDPYPSSSSEPKKRVTRCRQNTTI